MQKPKTIEHEPYSDEKLCIIRDIFEIYPPECEQCGLRRVCEHELTEERLERVIDQIRRQINRREFWEEYGEELYDAGV